jgi:hypothetical protein
MKNIVCWRDKTWCASSNCKNECGKKMPPDVKSAADNCAWPISYAYFCGELEMCHHESDGNGYTGYTQGPGYKCTKCGEFYK